MDDKDLLNEIRAALNELDTFGDHMTYTAEVVIPNAEKLLRLAQRRIVELVQENAALRAQLPAPDTGSRRRGAGLTNESQ